MDHPQPNLVDQLTDCPLSTVADYYAERLKDNPKAIDFVTDELRLTEEEAAKQKVGFSDRSLGNLIPGRRIKAGREVRDRLTEAGIYKANGREAMRGRVTVPVLDDAGQATGLRGYKIDTASEGEAVIFVGQAEPQPEPEVVVVVPEQEEATNHTNDTNQEQKTEACGLVVEDSGLVFQRSDRRYRIRGLEKNASTCTLKVTLQVSRDDLVHLDALDLVKARSRTSFIKAAADELFVDADLIKKDIGQLLLKLETHQANKIADAKAPAAPKVSMTDTERQSAMALLRDPQLLQRIVADMDACGIVGESTNKLAGYLAATSRKLQRPLAVVIQSSSSAGKTSLMDAVLSMMPPEDVQRFSGMTGQSLFYLESDQIRHKVLAIAEDEGIRQATYALKLLQSEGELRHATVGRGENGQPQTTEHRVEGPVQIFLTTTAMDIDEELVNRCFVLTVDETNGQTDAIQSKQRVGFTSESTHEHFIAEQLQTLHRNAQRLLDPVTVFNPYAPQLTFPNHKTRLRRDHVKYLTLINTIAFLQQHQRTIHQTKDGTKFVNVELRDIAVANGLAGEVLGRSLDELAPQTRNLLNRLHDFVDENSRLQNVSKAAFRFTRRDVRRATGLTDTALCKHLARLVSLEYVLTHRGRNGQRYVYELLYSGEGREGQPFLMGLIDPSKLRPPASIPATLHPLDESLHP